MAADDHKRAAGEAALQFVEDGMKLGLGTGSTAALFVEALAGRVKAGLDVVGVPTSEATRAQAERLGIRVATLDDYPFLDLTIDGADEIDPELRLIKGGGGAHLREKIVATASDRMLVIADVSKKVEVLGAFPLPIEVVPFGLAATRNLIEALAAEIGCTGDLKLRTAPDGKPFRTDSGNFVIDGHFRAIEDPEGLAEALQMIPGVVEHGLFLDIASAAIIAGPAGIEVIDFDIEES